MNRKPNGSESPVAGHVSRSSSPASLFAALATELAQLDDRGLRRTRRTLDSAQGARVTVDGREFVSFCSNDYLGLANDPRIVEAARAAALRYGVGAGASHVLTGHTSAHAGLEDALARFVGLPRALAFSTGYMANIGIVTALVGREDEVYADRLNHASLNDAALLSRAAFRRYAHGDLAALERMLAASRARRKLVVTDAVFSMDGDIAPVPALLELCERHDAWLMIDDAHGFGVLGRGGRGTLEHFGVHAPRIVYMATLGKAAGVYGAFVAGEDVLVETILQRARTYIYTTATPPLLAEALLASLAAIARDAGRREHLQRLVAAFRGGLEGSRYTLSDSSTPIQPVIVGENSAVLALAKQLGERGLLVPAIRPPTVPAGTARLRVSLSAAHSLGDVERLVDALRALA